MYKDKTEKSSKHRVNRPRHHRQQEDLSQSNSGS